MIDSKTGTLYLPQQILLNHSTNYDVLKAILEQQTDMKFVWEEQYGLFQIISLSHVAMDNKLFQFEIFFDKKILSSMMMAFTCTDGSNETHEQWLTAQLGTQRQFDWGSIKTDEHPKFNVPLISLKYT